MYPFVCKNCGESEYFVASHYGLYCHKCGKKYQSTNIIKKESESLLDIFISALLPYFEENTIGKPTANKCPTCGITWEEIASTGRFGCAEDYTVFADKVSTWLLKIHGANKHKT